ncbi:olfactory receptor 13F1-like [Ranitomeya variabilis]|uniref:olfactory receptor 13F1-like n=1 Tax=Ranitomeya variabilis TaxID=490064 RepID=UPI0040561FD0
MENSNHTSIREFILVGFSQDLPACIVLFALFLIISVLTILGNSYLIVGVIISPQLHTPMYYFLCHLSVLDLGYSLSTVPKLLFDIFFKKRRISAIGCLLQMNVSLFLGGTECLLLAVMAYDRYVAICLPLHYPTIMSRRVCRCITIIMWSGSFLISTVPMMIKPLVFCKENTLNHFACEILALLEVACGDLSFYKITMVVACTFALLSPFILIVVSYICITISILKIQSVGGRSKAFSTCASHLTVVLMFYGTTMTMYMGQAKSFAPYLKYIALIYAVFTPVLNPLIYSLRNNEVKGAFRKILTRVSHP